MWKATIASLRAHRLRLGLTALSIVLGVAFVTGTLIFTDTLHNTFDQLFGGVYGKISVQVRQPSPVTDQFGDKAFIPMPMSVLPAVADLPGVAASEGSVSGFAQLVDKHDKAITTNGAPTIGASYGHVPEISGFSLAAGHAPHGPGQVVIDKGTADKYGFNVGDPIEILFQGPPERFTVVGIVKFGKADGLGGATVAEFDLPVAQQLLNRVGVFDAVNLLAQPGVSPATLQATVSKHLSPGYQTVTGAQLAKENADQVNKNLSVVTDFLLVFALVSLFVGSFIILNTFSILVAQRTRELALFRALGARRRQVLFATMIEAAAVGLVAAVLGVGVGALLAIGLQDIFKAVGATIPSYGLVFKPRTAIVGLVVGIGVSLLASFNPARRAARVPPVAALGATIAEPRQTPGPADRHRRRRPGPRRLRHAVGALRQPPGGRGGNRYRHRLPRGGDPGPDRGPACGGPHRAAPAAAVGCRRRPGPPERHAQSPPHGGNGFGLDDRPGPGHHVLGAGPVGQGLGRTVDPAAVPRQLRGEDDRCQLRGLQPLGRAPGRRRAGGRGHLAGAHRQRPLPLVQCGRHRCGRRHHRQLAPPRCEKRQPVVAVPGPGDGRAAHGQLARLEGGVADSTALRQDR